MWRVSIWYPPDTLGKRLVVIELIELTTNDAVGGHHGWNFAASVMIGFDAVWMALSYPGS